MSLSQITQICVLLKKKIKSSWCILGVGPCTRTRSAYQGLHLWRKWTLPFSAAIKCPKLLCWGSEFVPIIPFHSEIWLAWACTSLVCAVTTMSLQMPLPGGAQKALFPRSPPLPLTLFLSTLLCIPGARQEDVWCGSPIQGWAFCGLSFSAPLLLVVVCVRFHLLQIDFLIRVERSIDLWE